MPFDASVFVSQLRFLLVAHLQIRTTQNIRKLAELRAFVSTNSSAIFVVSTNVRVPLARKANYR
jgi:rRNA pseudouridine-1189 N-methylase Emg1 (Nep1/Mra1 family)